MTAKSDIFGFFIVVARKNSWPILLFHGHCSEMFSNKVRILLGVVGLETS